MRYAGIGLLVLGGLLLAAAFVFANISILAPTGEEVYVCYTYGNGDVNYCERPSNESRLTWLYLLSGVITVIVGFFVYPEDESKKRYY